MLLPLPDGPFDAYLFDCDGTITDSMPAHYRAWQTALGEWGAEFDEELFYAWGGRPAVEIVADLNRMQGLAMPPAEVDARRDQLFTAMLPEITGVAGVLEHIEDAYGRVPFAVVSGGTRPAVTASLEALGLLDRFPVLVCAGDYVKAKPDPECFLLAARLLGVAPERCLVFEDTDLGIRAATAAGMASVLVPSPGARFRLANRTTKVPGMDDTTRPQGRHPAPIPADLGNRSTVNIKRYLEKDELLEQAAEAGGDYSARHRRESEQAD
jgi:beta-phosphoglucomutase-like phosphatase (HAD superfamily)